MRPQLANACSDPYILRITLSKDFCSKVTTQHEQDLVIVCIALRTLLLLYDVCIPKFPLNSSV